MEMFPFPKQEIRHRVLTTSTTPAGDDEFIPGGRIVEVHAQGSAAAFRIHREYLLDGDFESPQTWGFVNGVADVEGAQVALTNSHKVGGSGWRVTGLRTEVTLNKTSPVGSLRDAKMDLSAVDVVLANATRIPLPAGANTLVFTHMESDAGGDLEYAIVRFPLTGVEEFLQGGGTWSATPAYTAVDSTTAEKISRAFTTSALIHEVRFRPGATGLAGFAQIDRVYFMTDAVLASDVPLAVDIHKMFTVQEDSRLSVDAAGAGTLSIVEYGI